MFGSIGGGEVVVILVVALLVLGPRKLPQIGRTLGKALGEFRRATQDFKMNLEREVGADDVRSAGGEVTGVLDEVRNLGVPRGPVTPPRPATKNPAPPTDPPTDGAERDS